MLHAPVQFALAALLHSPAAPALAKCESPVRGHPVPTDFVGNRIFVRWSVPGHGKLRLYTDTGGGLLSLFPETVQVLSLPVDTLNWTVGTSHGTQMWVQIPPAFNATLVPPVPSAVTIRFHPTPKDSTTAVLLVDWSGSPPTDESGITWDGRLGSQWFADRVWTLDYPNRRMYFNGTSAVAPVDASCWIPLGFKTDSTGHRINSFPRITARINGEDISLLLDTGALTELNDSAWKIIGPREPRHRATSFITTERFEQWHRKNPDWLVVQNAEKPSGSPMIRVPTVEIGGRSVGPVWFTERPDRSFHEFMSQYMDKPIEGALGGSAWRYVTLVLDYPRARAALLTSR